MSEIIYRPIHQDPLGRRLRDALPPWPICTLIVALTLLIPISLLKLQMAWVIGAVVGLMGLALTVAFPYVGLLIFLGLLYLRPEESFPELAGARMTLVISLTVFFAWAVNACLVRERFRFGMPSVGCFLGFLTVAVGSTALSGSNGLLETALELLKLIVLFVLIVHLVNTDSRMKLMASTLVLFSVILGIRAIWQYYQGQAMLYQGELRALSTGIFSDPNDLALAMAMALPLALGALFNTRSGAWTRTWNLCVLPLLIWTVFLTNSRGGMLALGGAVLMFFGRRMGRIGVVVGALLVLGMFAVGPSRLGQMSSEEGSAQGRVDAWAAGLEMLKQSPVWGVGKDQFTEHHMRTAHNSLVLCQAEVGLLGTGLWIALFYFAFRDTRRSVAAQAAQAATGGGDGRKRRNPGAWSQSLILQVSLVTFIIGGFFLSRTYTPPLYVYLGLAIAAAQVEGGSELRTWAATPRDWLWIMGITLATVPFVMLLVRLWG
jgi:putative inorganic carbon (hco3(-)) transporter